jgi:hypothetical protein
MTRFLLEIQLALKWAQLQPGIEIPPISECMTVKTRIAANRQSPAIDDQVDYAEAYIHHLSPMKTLRLGGILSKGFWLPQVCKNFWLPT